MSSKGISKFSKKYGWFLSDATNEEILSISKELAGQMSSETKNNTLISAIVLSTSMIVLIVMLFFSFDFQTLSATYKNIAIMARLAGVLLVIAATIFSTSSLVKFLRASSLAPIMWRTVREAVSDESVYESMNMVKTMNQLSFSGRNNMEFALLTLTTGSILFAISMIIIGLFTNGLL